MPDAGSVRAVAGQAGDVLSTWTQFGFGNASHKGYLIHLLPTTGAGKTLVQLLDLDDNRPSPAAKSTGNLQPHLRREIDAPPVPPTFP